MIRSALIAALLFLGPYAGAAMSAPGMSLVAASPLIVAGTHFRAHERVTVTVSQVKQTVRTSAAGGFRADLGIALDRCSAFRIVAVGASGDRAELVRPKPMCAPASPATPA